jgi:RNA polymerase sigma factor (sigma-70 family)
VNDVNTGDLVVAAVSGDRQAFQVLVQRHAAVATGVAFSVCGDFSQSEDISQEAFIEAWKNLATLHEPEKFPAWLCTIVRRRAIDFIRRNKVSRPAYSIETLPAELSDPSQPPPETRMAAKQHQEHVWSLLRNLPEDYREPMILFYRCEQSTRDVAVALGVTESTIRQRLNRAREMIRGDVTETIRRTLLETVPKAVFSGIVMSGLPSSASAAGVTATGSAMIGKSLGNVTVAVAPAAAGCVPGALIGILGGLFGTLFGIMGGVFGTWMSWKNCDYESQQKVVVRQTRVLIAAMAVFFVLIGVLVIARTQGLFSRNGLYVWLLRGLIFGFQGYGLIWVIRSLRAYRKAGELSKIQGEPVREPVRQLREKVRQQTRVTNADGTVRYEAFRWNAAGWAGSCLGSLGWMVPLSIGAIRQGSTSAGVVTAVCFFAGILVSVLLWRARERFQAYYALQAAVAIFFALTLLVLAALHLLANSETQAWAGWTPRVYFFLLIYPLVALQFYFQRRSFSGEMLKQDADESQSRLQSESSVEIGIKPRSC